DGAETAPDGDTDAEVSDAPPESADALADAADSETNAGLASIVDLGADLMGSPGAAISSWGPSRLDVWVTGGDGTVWHRACDTGPCKSAGSWSGWENGIGGAIASKPAAISWGVGRIDVFGLDSSGSVRHIAFDGLGWTAWDNYLAGSGYKEIAVSSQ